MRRLRPRFYFETKEGDKLPSLYADQSFKKIITYSLRTIFVIGIATSIVSLPWFIGLPLALILAGVEFTLERAIYTFSSLYFHPVPDAYSAGDWLGIGWTIFPHRNDGNPRFEIGLLFKTPEVAEDVFSTIMSWNYHQGIDDKNNIGFSVIYDENENMYQAFIYPSPERPSLNAAERKEQEQHPALHHNMVQASMIFSMKFDMSEGLRRFIREYERGEEFTIFPYYNLNGTPTRYGNGGVLKHDLRLLPKSELKRGDLEYEMLHF
ncbi:MAG: hypothetical protein QF755_03390 [Candidatus Peribacteraceae bacterium]|jgi:hypothetical protein|nr:hypothetical protein [Candidatus Peribacteraceae bacterium]